MKTIVDVTDAFPEINLVLQELLDEVQAILGGHLVGMYLEGSLANGDFDEDSDIDFVVVVDEPVSEQDFSRLYALHERFNLRDTQWSTNLEGSYISQSALRRHDPRQALHPNMERGYGERLKWAQHDEAWSVHRWVLRERGITLLGPDPKTLVDPIAPDDLRRVMVTTLDGWAAGFLSEPEKLRQSGYQSYVVLSLCRILYTLQFGEIVSKARAAAWARGVLDVKWQALIDQAWVGRHEPQGLAGAQAIEQTLAMIRYALARGQEQRAEPGAGTPS